MPHESKPLTATVEQRLRDAGLNVTPSTPRQNNGKGRNKRHERGTRTPVTTMEETTMPAPEAVNNHASPPENVWGQLGIDSIKFSQPIPRQALLTAVNCAVVSTFVAVGWGIYRLTQPGPTKVLTK